jgi:2-iminoacetate synthase
MTKLDHGSTTGPIVREDEIAGRLAGLQRPEDPARVREILARALELHGIPDDDIATLMAVRDPQLQDELHHAARTVKETIYGNRLVIFAPLYVSNLCGNECLYCAFRASNRAVHRRALGQAEVAEEVLNLVRHGHKRVLLVAGESYPAEGFRYVLDCIETIYATREGPGEVRRVNVNIAPLTTDEFRELKHARIGTYQLFQETYHRATYARVHPRGHKADFDWRVTAMDRAMAAGIDDVGIGVLFGLADWRFDLLALMQHIRHLEARFGVGPHTISIPRIEPATGSDLSEHPPSPVTDEDFCKLIAILRLAVPYTGMIMSTRENAEMRRRTFQLGISQISAGSRTDPGGYGHEVPDEESAQFSLGDHRSLDEVVRDVAGLGFVPSFCTACYRLGRTGRDFMELAKPGEIRHHCQPNAVATFLEYLLDYASPQTLSAGLEAVERTVAAMELADAEHTRGMLDRVRAGDRDVFC